MPEPTGLTRKVALTDRSLKALKPAPDGKRLTVWDARMPGFAVRVTDKGATSFFAVRRRAGEQAPSWVRLGRYPELTLADARGKAREALSALMDGKHPAVIAEERRREEARRRTDQFAAVAEDFVARLESGRIHKVRGGGGVLRNAREIAAVIRREFLGQERRDGEWTAGKGGSWTGWPTGNITRRDIRETIERIVEERGLYAGRHAFAAARRLFKWAVQRDLIDKSPCEGLEAVELHGAPAVRDRVLNDDEIRLIWRAADAAGYPFGALVKTLLLTGQRRDEIGEMRWSEIKGDCLTIPAERMKGGIAQTVPLVSAAIEIFDTLPRFTGGDFVLSTTGGKRPIGGYSKYKARLDASILKLAREGGKEPVPPWTLHDLRRTVRTRLSALGVLPVIAELTIGHKQTGIAAVYDLHRYDKEKRAALLRWEALLLSLIAPDPTVPGNVLTLPARTGA